MPAIIIMIKKGRDKNERIIKRNVTFFYVYFILLLSIHRSLMSRVCSVGPGKWVTLRAFLYSLVYISALNIQTLGIASVSDLPSNQNTG